MQPFGNRLSNQNQNNNRPSPNGFPQRPQQPPSHYNPSPASHVPVNRPQPAQQPKPQPQWDRPKSLPSHPRRSLTKTLGNYNLKGKPLSPWLWFVAFLAAAALAGYFYYQYQHVNKELAKIKQNPAAMAQDETQKVVDAVSKLITLPPNEQPTLATVTNLEPLKDQPFFAHAEIGDKVIIYNQAKKVILFRPSENKIIEVAPLNTETIPAGPSVSQTPPKP